MTRAEYLKWCKDRALAHVDCGDLKHAFISLQSDLARHPETQSLSMLLIDNGYLNTPEEMRKWIKEVN